MDAGIGSTTSTNTYLTQSQAEKIKQAEKDAQARIVAATRNAEEVERGEAKNVDRIKDEYSRQYVSESQREEQAYAALNQKGYENLRDLKRAQDAEAHRMRRDGEHNVQEVDNLYKGETFHAEDKGAKDLKQVLTQNNQQLEYEKKNQNDELNVERGNHQKQINIMREDNIQKYAQLQDQSKKEYDRLKTNYAVSTEMAQKKFDDQLATTYKTDTDVINGLESRASSQILSIRADTSGKLAAYNARQADPFYKLMDTQAELHETKEAYILTARVPEHEQQHVSIGMRGNNIVFSGSRKNQEKLEMSPGRTKETAAYQSFNESFPINWPVDARLISKEFSGDRVTITIPKKLENLVYENHQKALVEREPIQRPHFPENIPYTKPDLAKGEMSSVDNPEHNQKSLGTRTLT